MNENRFEVSVLVLTYRPRWEELELTLRSVLLQRDVRMQIVIADDGSPEPPEREIREFMAKNGVCDYKLVRNAANRGTVWNLSSGVDECEGEYIKTISPGDMLYGCDVLRRWVEEMRQGAYQASLSDAVYYQRPEGDRFIRLLSVRAHPQNLRALQQGGKQLREDYLLCDDMGIGAAVLATREVYREYLAQIRDRLIFAEDNMWRLLIFDGGRVGWFDERAVLYEYGGGVSTNGSSEWDRRIRRDWLEANEIMASRPEPAYRDRRLGLIFRAWKSEGWRRRMYWALALLTSSTFRSYILRDRRGEVRMTPREVKPEFLRELGLCVQEER